MSLDTQDLARREQEIEAAQRRLRWLEIETRRMKAELARLSAACDDDVAQALSREWGRTEDFTVEPLELATVGSAETPVEFQAVSSAGHAAIGEPTRLSSTVEFDTGPAEQVELEFPESVSCEPDELDSGWDAATVPLAEPLTGETVGVVRQSRPSSFWERIKATPIACSFTFHTAAVVFLMFGVSYTVAKLEDHRMTLLTSLPEPESSASLPAPLGDEQLEPTAFNGDESAAALAPDDGFAVSGEVVPAMDLVESKAISDPLATSDIGGLDRLPNDLGTLLSGPETAPGGLPSSGGDTLGADGRGGNGGGGGKRGGGSPTGSRNATMFFGTHAKGNRFVFVIDNSSSMKNGRLDMARVELLRTVQNLTPKQSFYVIFVSDQTYPMFFPQREPSMLPATPANVKRLADWLPNAILASGKNRELIKAMDMAAALQPDAVYLLWDGDMKYSETVRLDVMTHLTAPNQWNFTVHTLGMGATAADAEQNLAAIAQAHGGVYRRITVPGVKSRK